MTVTLAKLCCSVSNTLTCNIQYRCEMKLTSGLRSNSACAAPVWFSLSKTKMPKQQNLSLNETASIQYGATAVRRSIRDGLYLGRSSTHLRQQVWYSLVVSKTKTKKFCKTKSKLKLKNKSKRKSHCAAPQWFYISVKKWYDWLSHTQPRLVEISK